MLLSTHFMVLSHICVLGLFLCLLDEPTSVLSWRNSTGYALKTASVLKLCCTSTSHWMDSVPGTLMHALLLKDHAKARLRHALTTVSTCGFLEATNVPVTEPFQWLLPWNGTPSPYTSAVLLLLPYSSLILKLTFILNLFCLFLLYCCLRFVSFGKGALQMPYIIIIIIIVQSLPWAFSSNYTF